MEQADVRGAVEGWLREACGLAELAVQALAPPDHVSSELAAAWREEKYAAGENGQLEGVIPLDALIRPTPDAAPRTLTLLLKARTSAGIGRTVMPQWLEEAGVELTRPLDSYASAAEFLDSRDREISVYRLQDEHPAFAHYLPRRFGDRVRPQSDEYLLLIERLDHTELMDTDDDPSRWTAARIEAMIDAEAALHAVWLGRTAELAGGPWPAHGRDAAAIVGDRELWHQLVQAGRRNLPELVDSDIKATCDGLVNSLDEWYAPHDRLAQTLVHDDLNPRTACFRPDGRPFIYDWELAMVDLPQRDLVELLTFALHPGDQASIGRDTVTGFVERHREELSRRSGVALDPDAWWEGFRICLRLEAINRVPFQWLFATAIELSYVERITATVHQLLRTYS